MQILKKSIILLLLIYIFSLEKAFSQVLLKGKIETAIQKGNYIEVNLTTPLSFYFTSEEDKVFGYINEDIKVSEDFRIPRGSIISGTVKKIVEPKYFGRDGSFEIEFDEITISGQKTIPIQATVSSDSKSLSEKSADILTYDSALIAYGTFNGALAGLQYTGIPLAITSYGISVLAGAGIGTGAGIIGSLVRKGNIPYTSYGQTSKFLLKSNLYILGEQGGEISQLDSQASALSPNYKGFRFNKPIPQNEISIAVVNSKILHNKKLGKYIELEIDVENNTYKTISFSDLKLKPSKHDFINPDLFLSGNEMLKSLRPKEKYKAKLSYLIQDKKDKFNIVLIDPLDNIEVYSVPLNL